VMKERLELAFAYSSRSSSPSKHCYLSQCTWTGFEDRCLFDVAFVTKWVLTQGDVVAHSDGTLTLDGFEDRCLFDVAFVTKWVVTQGDVVARSDGTSNLDGFEDQCLFDVAFVTKWVLTQGDVGAHSDGTLTWMGLRINVSLTWPLSRNGL
jgi:hypothetical protein